MTRALPQPQMPYQSLILSNQTPTHDHTIQKQYTHAKSIPPDMAPIPRALLTEIQSIEPTSFTTTSKSSHWRQAMNEEFQALLDNDT